MKKAIIITISIVTFLLVSFVLGIFVIPFYRLPAPVTLWKKRQVEKEYCKGHLDEYITPVWMDRNGEGGLTFYYGKYNGYYIFCGTDDVDWSLSHNIGDYRFELGSHPLYAKKDGKSYKLNDLYERGEISDEDLAKIYECHKNNPAFEHFYADE